MPLAALHRGLFDWLLLSFQSTVLIPRAVTTLDIRYIIYCIYTHTVLILQNTVSVHTFCFFATDCRKNEQKYKKNESQERKSLKGY